MSSGGIAFAFPGALEQESVKACRSLEGKSGAERYAWFFRKSRQSALERRYV
jgi:hypothetical protein